MSIVDIEKRHAPAPRILALERTVATTASRLRHAALTGALETCVSPRSGSTVAALPILALEQVVARPPSRRQRAVSAGALETCVAPRPESTVAALPILALYPGAAMRELHSRTQS